jgi:hypothetical protein
LSYAIDQMKRREFITLLSGAAAWPLAARAQQAGKLPTIAFLGASTAEAVSPWTAALVQRLRELGWSEGRTAAIEYRFAENHSDRLADLAAELVRLRVDVIVTHSAEPVLAAKKATSAIPIVFGVAADPVGNGLVASLARPAANVSNYCARLFPICVDWRLWPMSARLALSWKCARSRRQRRRLGSKLPHQKSGEWGISLPLSMRSTAASKHFLSLPTRS